ncbi:MAG: hypothetical protein KC729_14990, partial [Candidatus Eisenbacteria bacterium]|nr:hypothetical protein [Candidatus Eisenbacteria bacterium]
QGYGLWCGNWTPHIFRVYCNVFWQNDGLGVGGFEQDNWFGPRSARGMEGFSDFYSVLSDPEFCDDESYGVTPGSPIRMLTEPCMEVPGTGRACDGAPPVKNRSWGEVKRHFGR